MTTRRALLCALLMTLLWVVPAEAALYMEFDPPSARPGTVVTGRTAGDGALAVGPGRAFPVYLDPFANKDRIPIGHVIVDARGNGVLEFEVPDTPGGKYTVLMSCQPCAEYSAGRILVPLGDFRVLGATPALSREPAGYPYTPIIALALIGALLAALALRRQRRFGRHGLAAGDRVKRYPDQAESSEEADGGGASSAGHSN